MSNEDVLMEQFYSLNSRIAAGGVYWTQGQGSNISVKIADKLWIKASGFRLDEVSKTRGAVGVTLDSLRSDIIQLLESQLSEDEKEQRYADLLKAAAPIDSSGYRPSMETGFHAIIPATFVAHFHSLVGILLGVLLKSPAVNEGVFKFIKEAGYNALPLVIPQVKPGLALANYFVSETAPELILIENHGVIIHGEDAQKIMDKWAHLEARLLESKLIYLPLAPSPNEASPLASLEPLFPDFAVFVDRIAKHASLIQNCSRSAWVASASLVEQRNLLELWQAQWLLEQAQPQIAKFDSAICSMLGKMPTEMFRNNEEDLASSV